jgi:hypothetical protein
MKRKKKNERQIGNTGCPSRKNSKSFGTGDFALAKKGKNPPWGLVKPDDLEANPSWADVRSRLERLPLNLNMVSAVLQR